MRANVFAHNHPKAVLVLADGSIFHGESIGYSAHTIGEVVFNTAMTGYQEILTDPSYAEQIVTMTYPHIGNVGINLEDAESAKIQAAGLIIRELSPIASNWRSQQTLAEFLQAQKIVAIAGIDTRALTRLLRDKGTQHGCIHVGDDAAQALSLAQQYPGIQGVDLAKKVTAQKPYQWTEPSYRLDERVQLPQTGPHVVVYDFGVKRQILRLLVDRGARVTVVPATTPAAQVIALKPDGVVLSNGPGDPAACDYAIANTKILLEQDVVLFGICLGFQILALACGAEVVKMKFGHHGANHPIKNLTANNVAITSQNHSFCVDEKNLPDCLQPTAVSLFDGTLQGVRHSVKPALAMQGHPEASPGPHDRLDLFDEFIQLMQQHLKALCHAKT